VDFADRVVMAILSVDVEVLVALVVSILGYLTPHSVETKNVNAYTHVRSHVSEMLLLHWRRNKGQVKRDVLV
jgi:hypothetical protein